MHCSCSVTLNNVNKTVAWKPPPQVGFEEARALPYKPITTPATLKHLHSLRDYKKIFNSCRSIIAGDFNAKHTAWKCQHNNRAGTHLHELSMI
ncbi:hypothetical protein B566_EDAN009923, partial [Ephemera danica]